MEPATRNLDEADFGLIEFARQIAEDQSDGLIHSVGAAVRDRTGSMHGGINLAHFTGGPCAELVALGSARANAARDVTTIVAVGDDDRGVLAPCGRCRQILLDYHPGIRVILPTPEGIRSVAIQALLPQSYVQELRD